MRQRSVAALALALFAAASIPAWADEAGLYDFTGRIGPYPVGLSLRVAAGGQVQDGHYFYDRHLADIPLSLRPATEGGGPIDLSEPGGGTFRLRPVAKTGPVTRLADATGLTGTWTAASRTLPVSLQLADIVSATGRRYANVTTESDAAFEARVRGFRSAVLAGHRDAAAQFVSFPLRINGAEPSVIRTAAALRARWDSVFTPGFLARLRATVPHDLFVHDDEAMLGDGLVWFDATGAKQINPRA